MPTAKTDPKHFLTYAKRGAALFFSPAAKKSCGIRSKSDNRQAVHCVRHTVGYAEFSRKWYARAPLHALSITLRGTITHSCVTRL